MGLFKRRFWWLFVHPEERGDIETTTLTWYGKEITFRKDPRGELKKLNQNLQRTLVWGGTTKKFLEQTKNQLLLLSSVSKTDREWSTKMMKFYRMANKKFKLSLRSARRMHQFYERTWENMQQVASLASNSELPSPLRYNEVKKRLSPHEAVVIEEGSYYRGKLRDDFESVGKEIKSVSVAVDIRPLIQHLVTVIGERKNVGLISFMVELKELQEQIRYFLKSPVRYPFQE